MYSEFNFIGLNFVDRWWWLPPFVCHGNIRTEILIKKSCVFSMLETLTEILTPLRIHQLTCPSVEFSDQGGTNVDRRGSTNVILKIYCPWPLTKVTNSDAG